MPRKRHQSQLLTPTNEIGFNFTGASGVSLGDVVLQVHWKKLGHIWPSPLNVASGQSHGSAWMAPAISNGCNCVNNGDTGIPNKPRYLLLLPKERSGDTNRDRRMHGIPQHLVVDHPVGTPGPAHILPLVVVLIPYLNFGESALHTNWFLHRVLVSRGISISYWIFMFRATGNHETVRRAGNRTLDEISS